MLVLVNFVKCFFGEESKEKFTRTDTVEGEQTGLIFHLKSEIQNNLVLNLAFMKGRKQLFFDREFLAPLCGPKSYFFLEKLTKGFFRIFSAH